MNELSDEELVREQLERQQYALGGHDHPTDDALAALQRIIQKGRDSDRELVKALAANGKLIVEHGEADENWVASEDRVAHHVQRIRELEEVLNKIRATSHPAETAWEFANRVLSTKESE